MEIQGKRDIGFMQGIAFYRGVAGLSKGGNLAAPSYQQSRKEQFQKAFWGCFLLLYDFADRLKALYESAYSESTDIRKLIGELVNTYTPPPHLCGGVLTLIVTALWRLPLIRGILIRTNYKQTGRKRL